LVAACASIEGGGRWRGSAARLAVICCARALPLAVVRRSCDTFAGSCHGVCVLVRGHDGGSSRWTNSSRCACPEQHGPAGVAPPSVCASTSRQHPKGDNPPVGRQPVLHSRRHKPSVAGAQDGVNDKRRQKRNQGTDDKGEAAPPQPPRGQQGVIGLEATRRCPPHETYNAGEAAAELTRTTPTRCAAPHRRHATRAAPFTRQSTPAATRLRQHLNIYRERTHTCSAGAMA